MTPGTSVLLSLAAAVLTYSAMQTDLLPVALKLLRD